MALLWPDDIGPGLLAGAICPTGLAFRQAPSMTTSADNMSDDATMCDVSVYCTSTRFSYESSTNIPIEYGTLRYVV